VSCPATAQSSSAISSASWQVSCEKCGRNGSYGLATLIDKRGRYGKLVDWLEELTADCPKKKSLLNMSDRWGRSARNGRRCEPCAV